MISSRGIHKTSEQTLLKGRGILVTEKDKIKYNWDEIPAGSKFIDEVTGIEQVKVKDVLIVKATGTALGYGVVRKGKVYYADRITPILKPNGDQYLADEVEYSPQTDWVPAGIKNDGTLCIAKDAMIIRETFTIYQKNDGNNNMVYINSKGQYRRFPIQSDGSVVFELENGSYIMGRNHLEVVIDDCLHRTAHGGGVIELTEKRFAIPEELNEDQTITATYIRVVRIGNPYPRIFMNTDRPEDAEVGDLHIDLDGFIDTDLGVFIDKFILSDEPLDGGLQPSEAHTPPDDVEPDEANRPVDTTHDSSGAVILTNSKYKMKDVYHEDYTTMYAVPERFNTTSLTTAEGMFQNCANLKYAPTMDTSKFTSMKNMFAGCMMLYNTDTSSLVSTNKEFPWAINCSKITSIEGLRGMFNDTTVNKIRLIGVADSIAALIDFDVIGTNSKLVEININDKVQLARTCG